MRLTSREQGRTRMRCRPMPVYKNCEYCGQSFASKPSHADKRTYCSRPCMAEAYKQRMLAEGNPNHRDAGWHKCQRCGEQFHSYDKNRIHCSIKCYRNTGDRPASPPKQLKLFNLGRARDHKKERQCSRCCRLFRSTIQHRTICPSCAQTGVTKPCVVCGSPIVTKYKATLDQLRTCSSECRRVDLVERQRGELSHLWQGGKTNAATILRTSAEYKQWRSEVFTRDDYTCAMCGTRGGRLHVHHIKTFSAHLELAIEPSNGVTLCRSCHESIRGRESEHEDQFCMWVSGEIQKILEAA